MAHLLVVGVGGLGKAVVEEALERGLKVSVVVRNRSKLEKEVSKQTLARLDRIIEGDGTNEKTLENALVGVDAVVSGQGARVELAASLAAQAATHGTKLLWPAGATNVLQDDGVSSNHLRYRHLGSWVDNAFRAHGACIDAIRSSGATFVVFCPGRMLSVGKRSPVQEIKDSIRINRDAGGFVSFEDAAWVVTEAATTTQWDGQLISAGTKRQ